jgi:hypothetical protein
MKKLIVIASAVITIIYAIVMIVHDVKLLINYKHDKMFELLAIPLFTTIIAALVIIVISSLVLFNIRLHNLLRMLLTLVSILFIILFVVGFGLTVLKFISGNAAIYNLTIATVLSIVATITMLTYIRRASKPTEVKENK